PDRPLHRDAIICESTRPPELDAFAIADKYINSDSWSILPRICQQPFDRRRSDPHPPSSRLDEELSKVGPLRLLFEQGTAGSSVVVFKENGVIIAFEPRSHSAFKFANRHRVAMSFVTDQAVVHRCEQ